MKENPATTDNEPPWEQIGRLADFIQGLDCGEPSQSEGAVDTAIRMIKTLRAELSTVDEALARRPALEDCPDRYLKIFRICARNADLDSSQRRLTQRVLYLEAENRAAAAATELALERGQAFIKKLKLTR